MIELLAFVAFFTVANLFAGGKIPHILRQHGGPLPGRGIYYAGLAAIALGVYYYGMIGFFVGVSFLLWRLPGWYGSIDAGLDPYDPERDGWNIENQRLRDLLVMSFRGLFAAPVFVYVAALQSSLAPIVFLIMASFAQGGIYDLVHRYMNRNNFLAELFSGATWGVVFCVLVNAWGV